MEVVTEADDAHRDRGLIRLVCNQGEELHVTRSLLIRSSAYFAATLSEESGWEEGLNRTIELDGWSRNDLAAILHSIKTENTEPIIGNVNRYFAAIDYFSITPLMEQCVAFKIRNISDGTVIDDVSLAERFSIIELRDKCMEHLLRRLPEMLRNSRRFRRKMPAALLQKLLRNGELAVRHEDEVLSLIDIWSASGKRQSERAQLLQGIRFAHLTGKTFKKCRKDAQCQGVPQFRLLLETPRWSNLGESFLSGGKANRVHHHVVGILRTENECEKKKLKKHGLSARAVLVHCSETGTLSTARGAISEVCATLMIDRWCSAVSGQGLYVCQRARKPYFISWRHDVDTFTALQHFSDFRNSLPSSTIRFPNLIFAAAPPVVFENDVIIAHLIYGGQPTFAHGRYILEAEIFDELELLRYHRGEAISRRLRLPLESDSRQRFCHHLVMKGANKLLVNEEWTILCVPNQGVLLVIDAPRPVGPFIEIPEECWKMENPYKIKTKIFSDVVIVDNVAYVLLRFDVREPIWRPASQDRPDSVHWPVGSITAYDLTDGKWLPDHFLDLGLVFAENGEYGSDDQRKLELTLKVVQNKVFIIAVSNTVGESASGFPVATLNYVYRVQRYADSLRMCPVPQSASLNRKLKRSYNTCFEWRGVPLSVDAHPCKYATALQLEASREKNPIEREKLRRFTW